MQHLGAALARGWSLLPPLSGLDVSVLQENVPLTPSPLPASLCSLHDYSKGLSITECSGAEIFPGLLFLPCPWCALAGREHFCKAEIGHGAIWAGFFSCILQLFPESPQCFLSNIDSWKKEQWFLRCFQHRTFAPQNTGAQFHCPVLAVSYGIFSDQMGGVLLLLQRHCKWFAQFYWEQSCCGWWLWVLFLKVTQAFPSLGISAWVPPWLCRDGNSNLC